MRIAIVAAVLLVSATALAQSTGAISSTGGSPDSTPRPRLAEVRRLLAADGAGGAGGARGEDPYRENRCRRFPDLCR